MLDVDQLPTHPLFRDGLASAALLVVVVLLRSGAARWIEAAELAPFRRRNLLILTRNAAVLAFVGGLVIIWARELQSVALSLAAIAVALVIASKELILCLSGSILRISGSGFRIGDRIEIGGIRGDVIDIGALTTTLLEVGPGPAVHKSTGRTVVLPNSHFLLHPVTNETFTGPFVLHAATLPLSRDEDWQDAERRLLAAAHEECDGYLDDARANMEKLGRKHGLLPPSVEPQSWLRVPKPGEIELIVRFPAPARLRGQVEQSILRRFFESGRARPSSHGDEPRARDSVLPPSPLSKP